MNGIGSISIQNMDLPQIMRELARLGAIKLGIRRKATWRYGEMDAPSMAQLRGPNGKIDEINRELAVREKNDYANRR
jgi:hypothetical protein